LRGRTTKLLAAVLGVLLIPIIAQISSASSISISASADAFLLASNPNSNRGGTTVLRVLNDSKRSYVRFDVPALASGEAVTSAILRLPATSIARCSLGVDVYRSANDTWGEKTITWLNQPGPTGNVLDSATWTTAAPQDFDVTSAVSGSGPVSFLVRHAVGCAVKSDATFRSRETSAGPQLLVETSGGGSTTPPPAAACADGLDNDSDGKIDHPADPGCTAPNDSDETDPAPPAAACADGLDNDADGQIDHPADPGCTGPTDIDEADPPLAPQCADSIDNDADGLTDYSADAGCSGATDPNETDLVEPPGSIVAAAAGDIACDPVASKFGGQDPLVCQQRATAAMLADVELIFPLGDLQYPNGALDKFLGGYDPSWGQHAPRTYPAVGNHEYTTPGAQGYFDYWTSKGRPTGDPAAGYYSFDAGLWRVISLNSNCTPVPCSEGTPQNDFLEQDLATTTQPCIVAYWHHPYFNSGAVHGSAAPSGVKAFLDDLYAAGADLVLNGHEHNYQRYAKQTSLGVAAANGFREFIAGTGGKSHYGMLAQKDVNYEVGNTTDFGVLRLYLGDGAYSWEFVSVSGVVLDDGGPVACN
jgi:acid phosphatase type 7